MNRKDLYNPWSSFQLPSDIKGSAHYDIKQEPDINSSLKPVDIEDANLEAEVGEIALKPDLSGIYRIGGKTHARGGTPLKLQDGSFIFSNDKKLHFNPYEKKAFDFKEIGKGKLLNTPANVLKREIDIKHFNKTANILNDVSDRGYDSIAKKSAMLMQQKYGEKIGQVAFLQEAKKKFPTGVPDFSADTAPVYDPFIKDKIEENPQYMKTGGRFDTGGSIFPPDKTGKWSHDYRKSVNPLTGLVSNDWNAMTDFGSPEVYAQAVGYKGDPQNIKAMQHWVGQQYPDLVAKYHGDPSQGGYGQPAAGTPYDGKLGVRWQAIANDIAKPMDPSIPQIDTPKPTFNIDTTKALKDVGTPQNPFRPNSFNKSTTLPYNPRIPLSPLQKANLLYSGYQALTVPRYSPQRMNIQSPLVDLERYNPQVALNNVDNSAYQAYQSNRVSNPYLAGANNESIFGKSLDAKQQVLGSYADRNVGVANQQNLTNNQIQRGDQQFNTQANNNYYNQTQTLNQNYANEKRFATNQTVSMFNDYMTKNQALEQFLASQRTVGKVQVGTDKNGNPIYQSKPAFDVNTRGWSPTVYYTGAGSLEGLPSQSTKADDVERLIQTLSKYGLTPNSAAGSRIIASALGKGQFQQSYDVDPTQRKKGGRVRTNPFK